LHLGNAVSLPFPDASFDAVVCINTVHNLERADCLTALGEIQRITKTNHAYVQVDSYRDADEREVFLDWVLTAYTHDYPEGWRKLFAEAGYTGDYHWTFLKG
jgi:ubiquinone/menaquinone biosynthesis C-methylase UbiE